MKIAIGTSSKVVVTALVLAGLLSGGCLTLFKHKKKYEDPQLGMISFHAYYPPGTEEEGTMTLYHYSGKPVVVGMKPLLNSNFIALVEPYPAQEGWGIRLYLTSTGKNDWAKITSQYYGRKLVLVLDGSFRALVDIPKPSDTGVFDLTGPFTQEEARRIADYVNKRKG